MTLRIIDFADLMESDTEPTFGDGLGDGSLTPYQETPAGDADGSNDTFTASKLPFDGESLLVFVNGVMVPETEWTLDEFDVVFEPGSVPADGDAVYLYYMTQSSSIPGTGSEPKTEYRTLSGPEASAKQLTLAETPVDPTNVMVDILGGCAQQYGVDYTVTGSTLSWTGLALDGELAAADKLRITYFF